MNTAITEIEAVRKTVNKYEEGITTGNIQLLRSAFHPKAMMYGCSGENMMIVEIEGLYDYVAAQKSPFTTGEKHKCMITKIDVAGLAANVEVIQENCYGMNYTNYFQLLKIEDQWLIVSKAYNAIPAISNVSKFESKPQPSLAG